jgi:hypothetical protein
VQIHSESSFAAKMETHGAYEVARTTNDRDLKTQMEAEANARFAEVPRPEGAAQVRIPNEAWPGGKPPEQAAPAGRPSGEQPTSGTPPGMHDRGAHPADSEHVTPDGHEHRDGQEYRDGHDTQDRPADDSADDSTAPSPFVGDAEAVQIVRDHLHSTPAGYAFYPDGDRMLRFAEAVAPRAGVVILDLHGLPDGFHINGRVLTGEQFARAVEVMRQEGRIQLGEHQGIRLAACDIARGEDSPAARFARESGHPVTAPTERLWTNMRGEERVSSAILRDGRWVPAEPENGHWCTFGPDGEERTGSAPHGEPHTQDQAHTDDDELAARAPTPDYTEPTAFPQTWGKFNSAHHQAFAQVLGALRGNGDLEPNPGLRGGEGQLFLGSDETQALKRWFESRQDDMPVSVEKLRAAKQLVDEDSVLQRDMSVVEVNGEGADWIQRQFDPDSVPLKQAISDPQVAAARERCIEVLSGSTDKIGRDILRKLTRNSANLHWSPASETILIIDMQ